MNLIRLGIGHVARGLVPALLVVAAAPLSAATFTFSYAAAGSLLDLSGTGSFSTLSDADGTYSTGSGITNLTLADTGLSGLPVIDDLIGNLLTNTFESHPGSLSVTLTNGQISALHYAAAYAASTTIALTNVDYGLTFTINGLGASNLTGNASVHADNQVLGSLINFSDSFTGNAIFTNVTPPQQQDNGFFIRDLQTGSSIFTVADHGGVSDLSLAMFGLEHGFVGDLTFSLSHNGTTVLVTDPWGDRLTPTGSAGDLAGDYVLKDSAAPTFFAASQGSGPLSPGTYGTTGNPLAAFDGMDRAGEWTLAIADNTLKDEGVLHRWSLGFGAAIPIKDAAPEPAAWATMLAGLALGGAMRRRAPALAHAT
jgi:hypothetical protein